MKNISKCRKCFIKSIIETEYEYRNLDGTNNNLVNGNYGKSNQLLRREIRASYADEIGIPNDKHKPNPRKLSNVLCSQENPIKNNKNASNFFWLWGQFIDHDITLVDTHEEQYNIIIPENDEIFKNVEYIPFNRSKYNDLTGYDSPRNYNNRLTPFIDASNIYGSTEYRNKFLRLFKNGLLKTSNGEYLPINNGRHENAMNGGSELSSIFVGGDIRANEHLGLTMIHTLFVREHNYWAKEIKKINECLTDEEIYQKAKIIVEAELQAITFNRFLVLLLGKCSIKKYDGYNYNINPQVSNIFSVASYRLHSLIPSNIFDNLLLREMFFNPHLICNDYNMEHIIKNYLNGNCEEFDAKIVDDLRNFLFVIPVSNNENEENEENNNIHIHSGFDLASINIQRGRDHGLPDYNTARVRLGLQKNDFFDISIHYSMNYKLKEIYNDDIDNIDMFIGGCMEKKKNKYSMVGELLHKVILDQFERIRSGDRFWYQNRFNRKQIKFINNISLSDIIKRNTKLKNIPKDVFIFENNINN